MLLLMAVLLTMSGCQADNIDQYFSLPQPAKEYRQLQELIDQEIAAGCEYAAPSEGGYRQSVQFKDLNGDGVDEALAFFRDADLEPKIEIYTVVGMSYRKVLTLYGEGRSIGSVDYADMDADGHLDLIVAWQIAAGMHLLSVYSLGNWAGELLLSTDSTEFLVGDMNGNGRSELLTLRAVATGMYMADMYNFAGGREPQAASASLSSGIYELRRALMVTLDGGTPALLVESTLDNGDLVTDVLVCRDGSLVNMTLNRSSGVSETRRSYSLIYSQDINGDGVTEIPHPQRLYSQGDGVFWSIAWYRYDASGRASIVMTTYHSVSDGWYLVLPDGWDTGLTVRREETAPGERAVILSRLGTDGAINDLLAVYTITGENRSERAAAQGRFLLLEETSTVFAAEIRGTELTQDDISQRFHRIYSDWSAGTV